MDRILKVCYHFQRSCVHVTILPPAPLWANPPLHVFCLYFRASPAIRKDFLTEKVLGSVPFQISTYSNCLPTSPLSIPSKQSISGKGPTGCALIDIHSVKYFADLLIHAHTGQRSCCRDFPYELSALYTFEALEKFHPLGQIVSKILVGK